MTEIKAVLNNLHTSGAAITRKVCIAVGNDVLSLRYPEKMAKNGGSISLSTIWERNVLKSLDWVKRRGTTAKREINPALYEELRFSWKRKIAQTVPDHNIHNDMILNIDQTPLGFTAPNKTTYTERGTNGTTCERGR